MSWLFKQAASENWWIGYRLNGKQYRKSTGTADRKVAESELIRLRMMDQAQKAGTLTEEFYRLLTNRQTSTRTVRFCVEQWLQDSKELSPVTLERYRDVIDAFCETINPDSPMRDIQRDTVASFLRSKRASTSAATANLRRRILSAFFNHAIGDDPSIVSPMPSARSLKLDKDSRSERRAFTLAELKTLFTKAPNDFWRYMLVAGFYTALRMGDLITMPWGAVDFDQNLIRLTTRKTGRAMNIPIRGELRALLLGLHRKAGKVKPADSIWPEQARRYAEQGAGSFSNEFYEDVLLPAGLVAPRTHHAKKPKEGEQRTNGRKTNAVSFHCLRHTFVSLLKLTGGSQAVAKELAGHESDAVSDLYTHVPEEALSKAIKKLPALTA